MSTASWENTMRGLRAEFVDDARARLGAMAQHLAGLEAAPSDAEALQTLMRAFHSFSGSGATYGFPRITEAALAAEHECLARIREGVSPTTEDLESWGRRLAELREALDAPGEPNLEGRPAPPPPDRAPVILLVDDDPEILGILKHYVEQEGMTALTASTHAEALRSLESNMPDGLVVDIVLPDGTGYDLVARTRALPGGETPAVLVV
ncbi:MAG TPA: response regulator, partial [Vicinamibacteria bacterium]